MAWILARTEEPRRLGAARAASSKAASRSAAIGFQPSKSSSWMRRGEMRGSLRRRDSKTMMFSRRGRSKWWASEGQAVQRRPALFADAALAGCSCSVANERWRLEQRIAVLLVTSRRCAFLRRATERSPRSCRIYWCRCRLTRHGKGILVPDKRQAGGLRGTPPEARRTTANSTSSYKSHSPER